MKPIDIDLSIIEVHRYSKLYRLLRVTASVLKIAKSKSFCGGNVSDLSSRDIEEAHHYWVMYVQKEFTDNWRTRFKRLGASMDDDGIIAVGNRISNWLKENWDRSYLILLPNKSEFSKLVVSSIHSSNHDGVDATVAKVRRRYWIPSLHKLAKAVRKDCVKCRIIDKKVCEQEMGRLPIERLKPSPPFYYTGLDLFDPIYTKDTVKKRVKMKSYGIIFNCLTTRALHLDIACGYDTDNFLMVLRRFISIRGCPHEIRSDPGSQLIAAGKEINDIFDHEAMKQFGVKHGLNWIVNKSADAPWQNGCTERLIRAVKRCITLSISDSILTFPELQTVYFECASILNGRPIGIKNSQYAYFCPNDLLLGRASTDVPPGKFDMNCSLRKRYKFIENVVEDFWKRWQMHYFPTLILQSKWHVEKRNLCQRDIVLVQDTKALRGKWKLAEVHSV